MTKDKKILCAVDLTPGSERVVAQATELAELMGAELALLHVYGLPLLPLEEGDPNTDDEIGRALNHAHRALADLAAPARARGLSVPTVAIEGDVSDTILRKGASLGACMLVLGTHRRKGLKRIMLGSTAERVVRLARTPVVTVPMD